MKSEAAAAPAAVPKKRGLFYGWWIVGSGLFANFAYAEQFNSSYGVFVQAINLDTGWSRTALAGVSTLTRFPEAIATSLLGPFVDRHGARWLVAGGGLVVSGSFLVLSTIDELWQLYLYKGLVMAAGAAALGSFIGVTVSNWFVAKRGRAIGFISMGTGLASATTTLLGAFLIETWGWRQAWFAMGILVFVMIIPGAIFFRRRPEDLGLRPDGLDPGQVADRPLGAREARRREALLAADVVWTRGALLRNLTLWAMVFVWGIAGLAVTATNLHVIPYLSDLGYPLSVAAAAISLRAFTSLLTSPLWGFVAERVPISAAGSAQFLCKAASMLLFLVSPTPIGLIAALILYGIGTAGSQVLQETIWANYYGRISLGLVRGIVYPLQSFIAALGPLMMGLAFDLSGSYASSWLFLFGAFVLAAAVFPFLRPPRRAS